jgi:hypothetical protein
MDIYKCDEAKWPLELPPGDPRYRVCATSRVYTDSGRSRYASLQEFDKVKLQFGDIETDRVRRFVGSGRFSAGKAPIQRSRSRLTDPSISII